MKRTFLVTIPRSWVDKATPKIASDVDRGDMIRIPPTMEKAEGMNTLPRTLRRFTPLLPEFEKQTRVNDSQ